MLRHTPLQLAEMVQVNLGIWAVQAKYFRSFIVFQQLSTKAATTIYNRVLALFPDKPHPTPLQIIRAPDDTPIWSARYQQKGFARPLSDSPQQGLVQSICNQVVVSQGKLSKWQFSAFDFNLGSAAIAPVSAEIDIWNQDLADLPQGRLTARPLAMPGSPAQDAPGLPGAFRIRTSWTLSNPCLLYTSPSPRDRTRSRMPSSA